MVSQSFLIIISSNKCKIFDHFRDHYNHIFRKFNEKNDKFPLWFWGMKDYSILHLVRIDWGSFSCGPSWKPHYLIKDWKPVAVMWFYKLERVRNRIFIALIFISKLVVALSLWPSFQNNTLLILWSRRSGSKYHWNAHFQRNMFSVNYNY